MGQLARHVPVVFARWCHCSESHRTLQCHHGSKQALRVVDFKAPVSQILSPTNPLGVQLDHSYLNQEPLENFLASIKVTSITDDERDELQRATTGQTDSTDWIRERQKRLTASRFGRICKMTARTDAAALAQSFFTQKDVHTEAVNHGKIYEPVAVKKYEEQTGTKTSACGLFVLKEFPFVSATPDRVVDSKLLLEVKCPFSARDDLISPQTVSYLQSCNGRLDLHKNHDYYYQIQGQMLCTGAAAVDFAIYTFKDFQVIRVSRDDAFITEMLAKLKLFFDEYFKQALIEKFMANSYFTHISCDCDSLRLSVPGCDRKPIDSVTVKVEYSFDKSVADTEYDSPD